MTGTHLTQTAIFTGYTYEGSAEAGLVRIVAKGMEGAREAPEAAHAAVRADCDTKVTEF